MKNKENIKELMDYFQNSEAKPLEFDEEAIISSYKKDNKNQTLAIKILSVIGSLLASLAFVVFLFISGFYESKIGMITLGSLLIGSSILINHKQNNISIDTFSVAAYIIGFVLIGVGCDQLSVDINFIIIGFIIIALGVLFFIHNYILTFVSVLIINGSILSLIFINEKYNLFHIYVSILTLLMTFYFLKEAVIITKFKIKSLLYNPIRIGLIFSFLFGLIFLGRRSFITLTPDYNWLSSIIIISVIIFITSKLLIILNITDKKHMISIYALVILSLLPTALSPAIAGSILIILLCFWVNHKTGFVLGIVSFIYFLSRYYYDLNLTLLTKSILLMLTGVLFITLYLFINKKTISNEKV